jgi:hypothetical protein
MSKTGIMAAATAALLMTTAATADTMGGYHSDQNDGTHQEWNNRDNGYGDRDNNYSDRDYGNGFQGRDFDSGGRFYYGGNVWQRFERVQHWARYLARSGGLNRYEAHRAFDMLDSIRGQLRAAQYHGGLSPWRRMALNRELNRVVWFLRQHNDGRRYSDWGHGGGDNDHHYGDNDRRY